jgi:hypothetical protein
MRILYAVATVGLPLVSGCGPKGAPTKAEDEPPPGQEVFEAIQKAVEDMDGEKIWEMMSQAARDDLEQQMKKDQELWKQDPERLKMAKSRLKTDRDPTTMSAKELAIAMFKAMGADGEAKRQFRKQFGSKFISAKEEDGNLLISAEGPRKTAVTIRPRGESRWCG